MKRFSTIASFLFVFLCAAAARADRILLIEDPETRSIAARLRAELTSLGFDVEVRPADTSAPAREHLEDEARSAGAVAALRVRPSRSGVEVWVMDRLTSKTVLREVVLAEGQDESVVAIGAVELLRASLLEVEMPAFVPKEIEPTPALKRLVPQRVPAPHALSIALAPALAASPGGVGATSQLDVWGRLRMNDNFALGVRVLTPVVPAIVEGPEGRASVTLASASFVLDALLLAPGALVRPRFGLGGGALWSHMEGTAAGGFVGRGDDVFSAIWFVHAGAAVRASHDVAFFFDASSVIASPRPVVAFADRGVAHWGQPAFIFSLGIELSLL